jgi:hypothetical protein
MALAIPAFVSPLGKASSQNSAQPWREQVGDVAAPTRFAQAAADALVGDHKQCRDLLHAKALDEVRAPISVDSLQLERVVISPPLQNLR